VKLQVSFPFSPFNGGPNYSVHGKSVRQLPPLRLGRLKHLVGDGPPSILFELLADGYRQEVYMDVDLVVDGVFYISSRYASNEAYVHR
jgi:hypothetical protein